MDKSGSLAEYVPDAHQIVIEGQRRARITGVVDVESFHEEEAAILTEAGLLILAGEELKLTRLDPDSGQVIVDGRIQSLEYDRPTARRGLFARFRG
ncbi:MAG: sporulation protein [Clostridia bacterium]|nr:sporulation protein [Clostridia bacterium]